MTLGLCFWILMLIWLVFGIVNTLPPPNQPLNRSLAGEKLLLFILFLLLGWKTFGAPVHG